MINLLSFTLSSIPNIKAHSFSFQYPEFQDLNNAIHSVSALKAICLNSNLSKTKQFLFYLKFLKHQLKSKRFSKPYTLFKFSELAEQDWIDFFHFLKANSFDKVELFEVRDSQYFCDYLLAASFYLASVNACAISADSLASIKRFPKERFNKLAVLPYEESFLLVPSYETMTLSKQIKSAMIYNKEALELDEFFTKLSLQDILNQVNISEQIEQIPKRIIQSTEAESFFIYRSEIFLIEATNFPLLKSKTELLAYLKKLPEHFDEVLFQQDVLFQFLDFEEAKLAYKLDYNSDEISVSAEINFNGRSIKPRLLKQALADKIRYVQLSKSELMPIGKNLKNSVNNYLEQLEHFAGDDSGFKLKPAQFAFVKHITSNIANVTYSERYSQFLEKIDLAKSDNAFRKTNFIGQLRPYQEDGVKWLNFLKSFAFGGILADEMGLGKTVQIIAFLSQFENAKALILCPNSLLSNWQHECDRFFPKHNFVIVSYGQLRQYSKENWDYLILDEAQAIKNDKTNLAQSLYKLKCTMAIALTGTPIENEYDDLWSIIEFVLPKFLGSKQAFNKRYKKQIELYQKNGSHENAADLKADLKARIAPFILRRLKADKTIINDLPEKLESDLICSLTSEQEKLYKQLIYEFESHVPSMQYEKQLFKKKPIVLTLVLRLKQLCNHPIFIHSRDQSIRNRSGKFELLEKLAKELYQKEEKVLIFSQFAETCELINRFLSEELGIPTLLITARSEDRDEIIQKFQSAALPYQLIMTLKTGGVGLNLTAASTVIHFDRWWNPAVENQASDRAYRIGQKNSVKVYKFITENTIEEHISKLMQSKKSLFESVIESDEKAVNKLSENDLKKLIKSSFNS